MVEIKMISQLEKEAIKLAPIVKSPVLKLLRKAKPSGKQLVKALSKPPKKAISATRMLSAGVNPAAGSKSKIVRSIGALAADNTKFITYNPIAKDWMQVATTLPPELFAAKVVAGTVATSGKRLAGGLKKLRFKKNVVTK